MRKSVKGISFPFKENEDAESVKYLEAIFSDSQGNYSDPEKIFEQDFINIIVL